MINLKIIFYLLCALLLTSCGNKNPYNFKQLKDGPIKHQLIILAETKTGIKARGLKGSTPKNTSIHFKIDKDNTSIISNDDGSFVFELEVPAKTFIYGEFTFSVDDKIFQEVYKIKNLPEALGNIAGPDIMAPSDMHTLAFFNKQIAFLSPTAAVVNVYENNSEWTLPKNSQATISFSSVTPEDIGAQMIDGAGDFALITLFNTSELALLDLVNNRLISKTRLMDTAKQLYTFNLNTPLTVKNSIDALGDGQKTTNISRSFAHNAQAVLALDSTHYLVSFSNYYQFANKVGDNSILGPGIVALLSVEDNSLRTIAIEQLPYLNPQYFIKKDNNNIWVSCSGAWIYDNNQTLSTAQAGLVNLTIADDKNSFSIKHQIDLKDFPPAKPAIVDNKLVVPRSWGNEVAILNDSDLSIDDAIRKSPNFSRTMQFTFASPWHEDIVMLGDAQGSIVAFSLTEGFFPFPFVEPIKLSRQDYKIPLNPQAIYFRHLVNNQNLVDKYVPGFSAWVELPNQQKVLPLDFLQVFGP